MQLAAGWGCAAHHTAGRQAGALHAAVRAAPSGAAAHSPTAAHLAIANAATNAIAGLTATGLEAGWLAAAGLDGDGLAAAGLDGSWLAAAGLAAGWLAGAGATGSPSGTDGKPTEAGGATGHGVRRWVERRAVKRSLSFGCTVYICPFIYPVEPWYFPNI